MSTPENTAYATTATPTNAVKDYWYLSLRNLGRRLGVTTAVVALLIGGCGKTSAPTNSGATTGQEPSAAGASSTADSAAGPPWRPGYKRPMVIDIHGHIMPTGLGKLSQIMADNRLEHMVNLSGGSQGRGLETAVKVKAYFSAITHLYNPAWRERALPGFGAREASKLAEAVTKHGFRGLKISKALGLFLTDAAGGRIPVDWPELDPLWAKAGELGIPVMIHTGDPKAFWLPVDEHNERYDELKSHPSWSFHGPENPTREALLAERDRVIKRHPKTTFICVHFGGNPEDLDAVDKLLSTYPNAMVDTAARLGEIGRHPPEKVRALFTKHKTKIVFGTDIGMSHRGLMLGSTGENPPEMKDVKPFYDAHWRYFEGTEKKIAHPTPIQGNWTIDSAGLSEDVLAHLYRKNAIRVLKLGLDPETGKPAPVIQATPKQSKTKPAVKPQK